MRQFSIISQFSSSVQSLRTNDLSEGIFSPKCYRNLNLAQVTYLHRTQPDAHAIEILNSVQMEVLKAAAPKKLPPILKVAWAVETVAYLGGYLEHRRKTPIGIQVLGRGWLKLHDLCKGWQLARRT